MSVAWQDHFEIMSLKARYFRFLDLQQWDDLLTIFAPGAKISFPEIDSHYPSGEAFIDFAREAMDGVVSVHQGYLPEIVIEDDRTATGIWAMTDDLDAPKGMKQSGGVPVRMKGAGHYHERYTKIAGRWTIAEMTLKRIRLDVG